MEFYGLAYELVRAYDYVDFPFGKVARYLLHVFGAACAAQIVHAHREVFQTVLEGVVVLVGEHCRWHKHCRLLAIYCRLEGCTDCNLGLTEAHIAADEAVHGLGTLHVGFHGCGGFELVGRIFIDERCLKLLLHVAVGRECKAFLLAACRVEPDEVARYVLQLALGALFHAVPRSAAQLVKPRLHAFFSAILGKLVQRVYRHEDDVVVLVDELYHLLHLSVHVGAKQSAEFSHSVVHVHYVVAHLYLVQLFQREGELARAGTVALEAVFVETVENLVVGKDAHALVVIYEAFVQGVQYGRKRDVVLAVFKYHAQAFGLLRAVREYVYLVALRYEVLERTAYEVEILVIDALRCAVQPQPCLR